MVIFMTLMCTMDNFLPCKGFFSKHTNSPFVGLSGICKESAYTCKLFKLPRGTSRRSSFLRNSKGSNQITRYLFLRNNIQICFLFRNFGETSHTSIGSSSVVKYPTISNWWFLLQKPSQDNISLAVSVLPNHHQSSEWSQSVAHPCFHQ